MNAAGLGSEDSPQEGAVRVGRLESAWAWVVLSKVNHSHMTGFSVEQASQIKATSS